MRLPLIFLLLPLVFAGGPLTLEENDEIQKICGIKFAPAPTPEPRRFRSMNTPNATREEGPWTVAIRLIDDTLPGQGGCTGSFISSRHVVTAAHCVYDQFDCGQNPELFPGVHLFAVMTTTSCTEESCDSTLKQKFIRIKKIFASRDFRHCGGREEAWLGDVAVLELEEDVEFNDRVQPICLYDFFPTRGTELTMFGYGNTVDQPTQAGGGILRRLQATIVGTQECIEYVKTNPPSLRVQFDTICSRHPRGFACRGDSGSGQTLVKDGRAYLVGILSGGRWCRVEFTAEDIMDFSSGIQVHNRWIAAVTGVNSGDPVSQEEMARLANEYFEFDVDR